jgi:hypothetical protein
VVSSTRSVTDASEHLTKAVGALKLDKPRLLTGIIEIATELKASVANILEHTQVLVELDTSGSTNQSRERSTSQSRERSMSQPHEESTNESRVEFTQESRETPTNESRERSSSISFLFTSKDKLQVKVKNVRLTSRELAQTLRKYSFLSDERTGERKFVRGAYGTPISNGISRGLRDRTNSPVSFQKKIGHEFSQQTPPRSPREGFTVFRSKESPL